jgi:hypothetical protein
MTIMTPMPRSLKRSVLALGLLGMWGCAEDNEKNFASTPGAAPPGAPANSEEAAPAKPKMMNGNIPINE